MMEHVRKMPLNDDPRLFGLDTNANITFRQQESNELMDTILTLSGGGGGGGGGGEEAVAAADAAMNELGQQILAMFPGEIDREEAHPDTFRPDASGSPTALAVVLTWEIIRFNKLIGVVRSSMQELLKAIKGLVVMSPELEETCRDLGFQKVPTMWEKAAYPSLKPLGSWLSDLEARIKFVDDWMRDSRTHASFWISGFYFPQGFITGVKQQYARKTLIAIDRLAIRAHMLRNVDKSADNAAADMPEAPPPDGVFIHGLFLQGAHWDQHGADEDASPGGMLYGGCLADALPRVLFEAMPAMWLEPYDQVAENELAADGAAAVASSSSYNCPIYKTTTRAGQLSTTGHSTNFVMSIDIRFSEEGGRYNASHWVRRGVALIAQLDS